MNAVICYARLPEQELSMFKQELDKRRLDVRAVVTHSGEIKHGKKILPTASFYIIDDYNNPFAWDGKAEYFFYTRKLSFKADWNAAFDMDLYNTLVRPNILMYLPIVERFSPFEGGSMEAEIRLMFDFSKAHELIRNSKPEIVLFYLEPQTGLENMLYVLAKHYKIPCIVVRVGIFRHSCGVSRSFEAPLLDENWQPHPDTLVIGNNIDAQHKMHERTVALVNKIKDKAVKYKAGYMYGLNLIKSKKELIRHTWNSLLEMKRLIHFGLNPPMGILFKYNLHKKYKSAIQEMPKDKKSPLLFFPLHYQPELNTMPRGLFFVNQIKALKLLSDELPEGGLIIVKEHHGVFSRIHFANSNFRPSTFYNWIRRLPNVIMVSDDIHSLDLQSACDYVVTVTGNAGLEAMVRGKRVLHFGIAAYTNGPGVYSVQTGGDLKRIFNEKQFDSLGNTDDAVWEFIRAIDQVCYHTDMNLNSAVFDDERLTHWINALLAGVDCYFKEINRG